MARGCLALVIFVIGMLLVTLAATRWLFDWLLGYTSGPMVGLIGLVCLVGGPIIMERGRMKRDGHQ